MNIFTNALARSIGLVKSIPLLHLQSTSEFVLGLRQNTRLFGQPQQPYGQHAWVTAAINAMATPMSVVPFIFQQKSGRIPNEHAFTNLFEKPNDQMGLGQFFEAIWIYMHIHGECVIVLDRKNDREVPKGMMPVDPSNFREILSKNDKRLIGWMFQKGTTEIPFRPHEILFLRFFNPNDMVRGLSPLGAAAQGIQQDFLANQFNTAFFQNNGTPGGIIEVPTSMTDASFNRLQNQWEDHHRGADKGHRVAILEGGAQFKQLFLTQKDMDFLNQKKWNRDEILGALKVPKTEVGIWDDINNAVARSLARDFWDKNLRPKLRLLEWALWAQLFSKINGGRVWGEFDLGNVEALQDDIDEKVNVGLKLWQMGYPANQINKRLDLGLPENEWQEVAYAPTNMMTVQGMVEMEQAEMEVMLNPPSKDPTETPKTGREPSKEIPANVSISKDLKEFGDSGFTAKLTKRTKTFFFNQRKRQLKCLTDTRLSVLQYQDEKARFDRYMSPVLRENAGDEIIGAMTEKLSEEVSLLIDLEEKKQNIRKFYNHVESKIPDMIEIWERKNVFVIEPLQISDKPL